MKGWAKRKARSEKPSAWAGCLNSTTVQPHDFFGHTGGFEADTYSLILRGLALVLLVKSSTVPTLLGSGLLRFFRCRPLHLVLRSHVRDFVVVKPELPR